MRLCRTTLPSQPLPSPPSRCHSNELANPEQFDMCKIHILSLYLFDLFVVAVSLVSMACDKHIIQNPNRCEHSTVMRISETEIHLRMRTFTRISTLRQYTIVHGNYTYMWNEWRWKWRCLLKNCVCQLKVMNDDRFAYSA